MCRHDRANLSCDVGANRGLFMFKHSDKENESLCEIFHPFDINQFGSQREILTKLR